MTKVIDNGQLHCHHIFNLKKPNVLNFHFQSMTFSLLLNNVVDDALPFVVLYFKIDHAYSAPSTVEARDVNKLGWGRFSTQPIFLKWLGWQLE